MFFLNLEENLEQKKKGVLCGDWLYNLVIPPRWLIKGNQPILVLPEHVSCGGLINP